MPTRARRPDERQLRQLLVGKGLRVTKHRMAMLWELAKLRTPVSHRELTDRLSASALDRVTIYRNLRSLTKAGLLVRTQLGDNLWRFELPTSGRAEHGAHPHFVCNDCGDIACLPESAVTLRGPAVRNRVMEVQLRGHCIGCAGKRSP